MKRWIARKLQRIAAVTDQRPSPVAPISASAVASARESFDASGVIAVLSRAGLDASPAPIVIPGYGGVRVADQGGQWHVGPSGGMTTVGPEDGSALVVRWEATGTADLLLLGVEPTAGHAADLILNHQASMRGSTRH